MPWTALSLLGFTLLIAALVVALAVRLVRLSTRRPLWGGSLGESAAGFLGLVIGWVIAAVGLASRTSDGLLEALVTILVISLGLIGAMLGAYLWYQLAEVR